MSDKLKQSVKNYLGSKQLSPERLDNLESMLNADIKRNRNLFNSSYAAVILIASLALAFFIGVGIHKNENMAELIAEEVAYNHLKMKPMEVSGDSLGDMKEYFSKLDFSLTHSKFVSQNGLKLMGGRYCSIQGDAAAQLRMQDVQTGAVQIVYQAPYNKELFRELPNLNEDKAPERYFINGVAVDVWVEKGILFARSFEQ